MLGERLIKLRKARKLTQQQIADRLHLSRGTYAQYEIDRRVPEYATLEKLADFFEVSIDYLVGREVKQGENIVETEADLKRRQGLEYIKKIKDEKTLDLAIELLEKLSKE